MSKNYVGIHVSIAKDITLSFERAFKVQAETFQIFLKSPRTINSKYPSDEAIKRFRDLVLKYNIPVMVHAPYTINLCSKDEGLRRKSVETVVREIEISSKMGVKFYNIHMGSAKDRNDEQALLLGKKSLEEIYDHIKDITLTIENTSGKSGDIGKNFEEIKFLLENFDERVGICLDSCHIFAYGYDISSEKGFSKLKDDINYYNLISKIKAIHCNDSKAPLGSKKDRHEHIGEGFVGIKGFENLLKDKDFKTLPFYLETPWLNDEKDKENVLKIKTLRDKFS